MPHFNPLVNPPKGGSGRLLALGATVFLVAGCGSSGDATSKWAGPPRQHLDGQLPISGFNDFLSGAGKAFASSPIAAVTEFLRLDKTSAAVTDVRATFPGEVRDEAQVVATLDGLLDDSVRTARYTVDLHRDAAHAWTVRRAEWAQACRPGRGHLDFSAKRCV